MAYLFYAIFEIGGMELWWKKLYRQVVAVIGADFLWPNLLLFGVGPNLFQRPLVFVGGRSVREICPRRIFDNLIVGGRFEKIYFLMYEKNIK